jgi:hypothetical protein
MSINVEGKVLLEGEHHTVEYEPSGQTGLGTIYLRCSGAKHNVPIYYKHLDEAIDMMNRMRSAVEAIEDTPIENFDRGFQRNQNNEGDLVSN